MENEPIPEQTHHPERPLECSECKKDIRIHYTEIIGNTYTHTGMCNDCPQLLKRLKGAPSDEGTTLYGKSKGELVCGECGTTLEEVTVSHLVGCSHCYKVFSDILIDEMLKSNKVSPMITKRKRSVPFHVGRSPGETQEVSPTLRLIALNEALEETLKKEDYEQAAWLRDQIKALTEEEETESSDGKTE